MYGPVLRNFATFPVFCVFSLLSQPDNMCLYYVYARALAVEGSAPGGNILQPFVPADRGATPGGYISQYIPTKLLTPHVALQSHGSALINSPPPNVSYVSMVIVRCATRGAPTISRDKRRQPLKSGWEYCFHWKEKTGKVVECPYILYGPILRNFATLPVFSVSSLLPQPDNMCLIVRIRTYVSS